MGRIHVLILSTTGSRCRSCVEAGTSARPDQRTASHQPPYSTRQSHVYYLLLFSPLHCACGCPFSSTNNAHFYAGSPYLVSKGGRHDPNDDRTVRRYYQDQLLMINNILYIARLSFHHPIKAVKHSFLSFSVLIVYREIMTALPSVMLLVDVALARALVTKVRVRMFVTWVV